MKDNQLRRRSASRSCGWREGTLKSAVAVLLALLLVMPEVLLAQNYSQPELPNPGSAPLSREQQEQLGQKAMAEVYQQMPVLPDSSPVTQYVQRLGQKLVSQIPQQYSWPYQFHVVQQKEINAFALPGGPLFVNVGTIDAADNEAELAGVMAHEMAHVYMQHSAKMMKQNVGPSILAGLGQVLGQMIGGVGGALASLGGQVTGGLMSMKYSRADEAQADAVGAIIMYKAGYNPQQMAAFFQKLEKEGGGGGPQFMSDHPDPGNRYAAITKEIKQWPPRQWVQDTAQFDKAKNDSKQVKAYTAQQISAGAKSGTWARQNQQSGATPANLPVSSNAPAGNADIANATPQQVKPSGSFQQYSGQYFSMQYPQNWQVYSDQQTGGVTIAPAAGISQGAVAYGVIVNGVQDPNASSPSDAMQYLISGLKQSNPDLATIGSPQPVTVNGIRGQSVTLRGTSPVQKNGKSLPERDWLVMLPAGQGEGTYIYTIFVAPENAFGNLRSTYEKMLRSLHLE